MQFAKWIIALSLAPAAGVQMLALTATLTSRPRTCRRLRTGRHVSAHQLVHKASRYGRGRARRGREGLHHVWRGWPHAGPDYIWRQAHGGKLGEADGPPASPALPHDAVLRRNV